MLHYTVRDEVIERDTRIETYTYRGAIWIGKRRTHAIVRAAADNRPSRHARAANSTLFNESGQFTAQDFYPKTDSHK